MTSEESSDEDRKDSGEGDEDREDSGEGGEDREDSGEGDEEEEDEEEGGGADAESPPKPEKTFENINKYQQNIKTYTKTTEISCISAHLNPKTVVRNPKVPTQKCRI